MVKVEAEAVPFYPFQLPIRRKFAASTASALSSSFRFHIPALAPIQKYRA